MHSLIISHYSALNMYRSIRGTRDIEIIYDKIKNPIVPNINKSLLKYTNIPIDYNDLHKLDVLSFGKNSYRKIENVTNHYYINKFPKNSFCKYSNDILITSPELTFCLLSSFMNFEQLVLLGFELCGTYSFPEITGNDIKYHVSPVTYTSRLSEYVNELHKSYANFQGIYKALNALEIIADGSASPQESNLFTMLCAPKKFGGYGVNNLELNKEIDLSPTSKLIANQNTIKPDICNKKNKFSIEYDSNSFHDNYTQNSKDKCRINALNHDGWKVFSFVPYHTNNINVFHNMAINILKANKQDTRIRMKNFYDKRDTLHRNLSMATKIQNWQW